MPFFHRGSGLLADQDEDGFQLNALFNEKLKNFAQRKSRGILRQPG